MSESNYMLAGPGLLRSDFTMSVNPHLKLKSLSIRDRIVVPDPSEPSEAANRRYVDQTISRTGVVPGFGINIDQSRKISLQDDLTLNSLKIIGNLSDDGRNVVTKDYVDGAVIPLVSRSYVDDRLKRLATKNEVVNAVEPLATRVFISTLMDKFVEKETLQKSIKPLTIQSEIEPILNDKASILFVQNEIKKCQENFIEITQSFVEKKFIMNKIKNLVTQEEVLDLISKDSNVLHNTINDAIKPLATKEFVEKCNQKHNASIKYLKKEIEPLVTRSRMDAIVSNLAEESFVLNKIADSEQNSKSYVDSSIHVLSNTLSSYVDNSISTAIFPLEYPIQYKIPENGDTVESNGKTLFILDPVTPLETLTITFPIDVDDGKYLVISSSRDIESVTYENLVTAGDIPVPSTKFKAGESKKWVFCKDAKAWFVL